MIPASASGRDLMKRPILLVLVAALACAVGLSLTAQEANVSHGRTFGLGIQADYPFGGLVSARYWFSDTFALEETAFVSATTAGTDASLTTRALYRVADASTVDFYVAPGASLYFSPAREEPTAFSLVGGIEFDYVAAPNLAWNIEFGVVLTSAGFVNMCLGTGVHFYF